MTPHEIKAKELVEKFEYAEGWQTQNISKDYAKQCAIICVDEIIKEYDTKILSGRPSHLESRKHFWKEVKQSINNL